MTKTGGRRGSNQYGPIGVSQAQARRLRQDPLLLEDLADLPPQENPWEEIEVFSVEVTKRWYEAGWHDPEEAWQWFTAGYEPVGARILANAGFPPPPNPRTQSMQERVEVERSQRAVVEWVANEIKVLRAEHALMLERGEDYDLKLDAYMADALRACDLDSPKVALSFLASIYQCLGRIPESWQV